jgi:TPR repeat protein
LLNPEPSPDRSRPPGRVPTPPSSETVPTPPSKTGQLFNLQVRLAGLPNDPGRSALGGRFDVLEPPLARLVGLKDANGVVVIEVTPGGPSAQAGMRVGDIMVSLNRGPVANVADFRQRIAQTTPGMQVAAEVWRYFADGRDLLPAMQKLADEGNPGVMLRVGLMHASGHGAPRDDFEAVRWYRKSVNAGNTQAAGALAYMLLEGRGTDKNPQEAERLLQSASDAGNAEATWRLGRLALEGKHVTKDLGRAAQLFQKASDAGHSPAMVDLGLMYNNANGLPRNVNEAARWFKRASDLGNTFGMVNYGLMHAQGLGVPKNDAEAVELYRKAVDLGNLSGMYNLALMYDQGRGVGQKDPDRAAELMMRSLALGHEFSHKQMVGNAKVWSVDFRRSMQRRLKGEGLYTDAIDGEFRPSTTSAVTALYNRQKR